MGAQGVMLALTIMGTAATLYGAKQQYEAGLEAERIASKNAAREEEMAVEEARRLKEMQEIQMSENRLRVAAAGITEDGSVAEYLAKLRQLDREEVSWILKSGRYRAEAALETGELASQQAYASMWGGFATAAGQAGSGYFQMASL